MDKIKFNMIKKIFIVMVLSFIANQSFGQTQALNKTKIELQETIELMVMDLEKTEKYYLDNFDFEKLPISQDLHKIKRYLVSSNGKWLILKWGRMKPIDTAPEAHVVFIAVPSSETKTSNLLTESIKTDPEGYKIKIK